ncbi:MAG: hypothetical protein KIT31_23490 [Deltaproteobacteria bacterium]|nr:hypothetical protein [Deltaproteobacteria bacterium]
MAAACGCDGTDPRAPTPDARGLGTHTGDDLDDPDRDLVDAPLHDGASFALDLQPILSQRCAGSQCHGGTMPADGVHLVAGAAYASLVGVRSTQCDAFALVEPGAPAQSYLMWKLAGSGGCFGGERMPRGTAPLSAEQIALFERWISAGAPDN